MNFLKNIFNREYPGYFYSNTYREGNNERERIAHRVADNCYRIEERNWGGPNAPFLGYETKPLPGYLSFSDAVEALLQWDEQQAKTADIIFPRSHRKHAARYAGKAGINLTQRWPSHEVSPPGPAPS